MRRVTVVFFVLLLITVPLFSQTGAANRSAEELLRSGLTAYRAGDSATAATELSAAAQGYLSPEQMEKYVSSGHFENLAGFETALIYLALAEAKNGKDDAARESILRLATAERISPTYTTLTLDADAAEFEPLVTRLVPDVKLQPNTRIARGTTTAPMPTPTTAPAPVPAPPPVAVAEQKPAPVVTEPAIQSAPLPPAPQPPTSVQTAETERLERERYIERRLAEERAKFERAADERIATERAAIQRDADSRVAAAVRAADERIAAERAAIQKASIPPVDVDFATRREYLARLRDAEGFVSTGDMRRGADIYLRLARQNAVPRDILAEAATGLYRTASYREAVEAFARLGTFARGEEDLRYYHAVALYETGQYDQAQHELSCAIPFIQVTDEVARYRAKIEKTAPSSPVT